jgi:hypothetical protein
LTLFSLGPWRQETFFVLDALQPSSSPSWGPFHTFQGLKLDDSFFDALTIEQSTMASDQETRIVGNRLGVWFALGAFSSIALVALVTRYDSFEDEQAVIKWALATFCIAIGMAGLALIATVAVSDKFTSTKGEGVMVSRPHVPGTVQPIICSMC